MVAHANAAATPVTSGRTVAPLTFPWTHALAARFPGCSTHLPAGTIPSAFVVERLSGHTERMAFDEAWKRTHDKSHADDIWVRGMCR
jgi:hypothetical protein